MITVQTVKNYLRIPYDDDDQFIKQLIDGGYDYLRDAVDDFDKLFASNAAFARKADLFVLCHWTPTGYDQREGMTADEPALNYSARSLLTQMQLYHYEAEEVKK